METVEIIVYLGIAVIAGGLILVFVADLNPAEIYRSLRGSFFGDDQLKYKKVPAEEFAGEAYRVWERCGFGAQEQGNTLYVTGTGAMDKPLLFTTYKKLNLCSTIQSQSLSCGAREDVDITHAITLPAVIHVECNATSKMLVFS